MSETETNKTRDSALTKTKNDDPYDETYEKVIVNIVLGLLMTGLFGLALGIVWAIKDIFSQSVWEDFVKTAIATKLFWIGMILLGIFFLVLFLFVLYRRGRSSIANALFKKKPDDCLKQGEEYLPAKIITAGALISILLIFIGLIIATIDALVSGGASIQGFTGFWEALGNMPGGLRILMFSGIFLILDGLIYGFVYIWMHGQGILINKILKFNKEMDQKYTFSNQQKIVGRIIFGIIALEICVIVFGILWSIVDGIKGDASVLDIGSFGIIFAFYSFVAAALFMTLIGVLLLYKRGMNLILVGIFIQISPQKEKTNTMGKVITIGFLTGIGLMALGLLIWFIDVIVRTAGDDADTLFSILSGLSAGLELLSYGMIALIFTGLGILFSFFFHNGYAFTMQKILKIEEKIDEGLDDISKGIKKGMTPKKTKKPTETPSEDSESDTG